MTSWLNIPGCAGQYQISNDGRVRNANGHVLKPRKSDSGYLRVWLSTNGKPKCYPVHRLVATAFLPNPDNLPEVNHINGVKTDNRMENLEWCTTSHNRRHSSYELNNESGKPKRPVVCIDLGWIFPSVAEAARAVRGSKQNIVACCQGKRNSHMGLRWAYVEEVRHG